MDSKKILLVEDDVTTAKVIELQLVEMGYAVVSVAKTGPDAIEKAKALAPDLLLMDIKLGQGMDGIEAAAVIRRKYRVPVIYLTAYADEDILERAKSTRPLGYVNKPLREADLRTTITLAFEHLKAAEPARNDECPDRWRVQICCNLAGEVIRLNPLTMNKIKLLGFSSINYLLPKQNPQHVAACLTDRKPRLITGRVKDKTLSWEYTPTSKKDTVRITITDITLNTPPAAASFQPAMLAEILDQLAIGVMIVNENLHLFYQNQSAHDLLQNGRGLTDHHGCLNCSRPEITARLQKFVLGGAEQILTIENRGEERPLHLWISPLNPDPEQGAHSLATAVVFTVNALNNPEDLEDLIRQLYNLSPSEAKIAARLIQTPNLEQVAASLGISRNTARTHLKRIFIKTNINRLSSLIHLILTGPAGIVRYAGRQE